jgi:prepilin-type processing-associated H-X9-DG protein
VAGCRFGFRRPAEFTSSNRHGQKADITFADGHVSTILPKTVAANPESYQPDY